MALIKSGIFFLNSFLVQRPMIPMLYGKNLSDFSETWITSDKIIPLIFVVPKVS